MAVKVVSEGPVETLKTLCRKCRYALEYTPVDVHKKEYRDISGTMDTEYSIVCPRCDYHVPVKPVYY